MNGVNCPNCNERYEGPYYVRFIEAKGSCKKCFQLSKGLVKAEEHSYYVPWAYRHDSDTELPFKKPEYFEEVNLVLPKISWDEGYKKWKLCIVGADCGGYDMQDFEMYFDTQTELLAAMGLKDVALLNKFAK